MPQSPTSPLLTSPRPVRDLRWFWRRAIAVVLPVPMLAVAGEQVVNPYGLGATPAQQLALGSQATGRLDAAIWLALLGALLCLPAALAVAWTSRRAAPRLTLHGAVLTFVGFAASAAVPPSQYLVRAAAAEGVASGPDAPAVVAALSAIASLTVSGVSLVVFLVGQAAGLLLLGLAQWRTPGVPRWTAVLLAISGVAHVALSGTPVGSAVAWAGTAVGFGGASWLLWRMGDDSFDLPPTGRGVTMPAGQRTGVVDPRRIWKATLAITAPVAAVALAVLRLLLPYSTFDAPRQVFDKLVADPAFAEVQLWTGLFFGVFGVSGVMAVVWVTRRRTPLLTTVAGTFAVLGYIALGVGGTAGNAVTLLASRGQLDPGLAFRLSTRMDALAQSDAATAVFVLGHLLGTILLGVALWRSRALPAWVGITLAVSQPLHLVSAITGNHPLDLVAWGATALCFGLVGAALIRTSDDEFDLPPVVPASPHVAGPDATTSLPSASLR